MFSPAKKAASGINQVVSSLSSLLLLLATWLIAMMATATEVSLTSEAEGERRGVSIAPVFPLLPLLQWGIAAAIDHYYPQWGTWLLVYPCAVVLPAASWRFAKYLRKLRERQLRLHP